MPAKRLSTEQLKRRGSPLARSRAKAESKSPVVPAKRPRARQHRNLEAIIRTLPGYDPFEQAEGYTFNAKLARKAINFIECECVHVKGALAGKRFLLERWQKAIVANIFGWVDDAGLRRYREVFLYIPRKNGKSCLAACIIMFLLFEDSEPFAEIAGCAAEYKQASLIFDLVRGMLARNPRLAAKCKVFAGQAKSVELKSDFSIYRVMSAESYSKHGLNCHGYVIDEVHCLPDSELIDTLETSTGARKQPLGLLVTTADYNRPGSPCISKLDYSKRVRDGIIEDATHLPIVYEADVEDDWKSPEVWARVNPNLGVSLSRDYLTQACRKAESRPAFENSFRRLHLNITTEADTRWLSMDAWDSRADEPIDLADYVGRECWAGLDLATSRDMTALVLCFPEEEGSYTIIPKFWIPKDTARERSRKDRIPYIEWIAEGLIEATDGSVTDYAVVRRDINALVDEHGINIREIAIDRLFQGAQLSGSPPNKLLT